MLQNVYISLPYIMAARTAGIDKNEEINVIVSPCTAALRNIWGRYLVKLDGGTPE